MMVTGEPIGRVVGGAAGVPRPHRLLWTLAAVALIAALALAGFVGWRAATGATSGPVPIDASMATAGPTPEIVIMSSDAGCGPREIRVGAPGPLPITFHNHGTSERTLTIEGVAGAVTAEPGGGVAAGTFALPRAGTYIFWCATAAQGRADLQERWVKGMLIVGDGAAGRP